MEREFVPYQQAVELKKLGFNQDCLGRWLIITEWEKPTGEIKLQLGVKSESWDKNQCIAPLYQQAFKWLNEKLNTKGIMPITDNEYRLQMLNNLIKKLSFKK